jgi:hypothetical protein
VSSWNRRHAFDHYFGTLRSGDREARDGGLWNDWVAAKTGYDVNLEASGAAGARPLLRANGKHSYFQPRTRSG